MTDNRQNTGRLFSILLLSALILFSACQDPFTLEDIVDGPDGKALTVSPSSTVLLINSSLTLDVSGGIPPYTYTVVSGTGSIIGNIYTAPTSAETTRIRISDDAGNKVEAVYTIDSGTLGLGISPTAQTVYTGGSLTFSGIGGTAGYTYDIPTNNSGGSFTGANYTAGNLAGTDTVRVTDSALDTATTTVTVVAKPLSLNPQTITVYTGQTVEFAAVGGDGPFSYAVTTNGSGSLTGIGGGASYSYTAGPNPGTDQITLTDGYDGRSPAPAVVTVVAAPVVTNVDYAPTAIINVAPAATAQISTAFTADFNIDNNGSAAGSEDLTWRIYASTDTNIGGSDFIVDFGTILGGTGAGSSTPVAISGTWPSVAGDYYLLADVAAADDLATADNQSQSAAQVDVYTPLTMTPPLIDLYAGQQITFDTSGGSGTYTYAITTTGSSNPGMAGNIYTAGDNAGTDIVTVTDTVYSITDTATVNVSTTPLSTTVDYVVGTASNLVSTNLSSSTIDGDFTLDNIGTADGGYPVAWSVYASANTILGPQDFVIDSGSEPQLTASSGTSVIFSGTWPAAAGDYYLIIEIETLDDNTTGNNRSTTASQTTVSGSGPLDIEYVIPAVSDPGAAVLTGSTLNESFDLQNSGTDAGTADVYWTAYLSADMTLDTNLDTPIDSGIEPGLGGGASNTGIAVSGSWPTTAGTWYLIVTETASDEQTAGDIGVSAAVTVADPAVDYRIPAINVTGTPALVGSAVSADFQIENISSDPGTDTIYWTAYASLDTVINSGSDPVLASGVITADIAGGAFSTPQTISGNWPTSPGSYYVLVRLYSGDDVNGVNDQQQSGPHTISLPNIEYGVSSITAGDPTPNAGSAISESFTLHNSGADAGSASLNWYVYLSTDNVYDPGVDLLIDSGSVAGGLDGDDAAAGGPDETTIAITATWPETAGTRYLIVRESADDETTADEWLASAAFAVQSVSLDIDYLVTTVPAGGAAQVGDPINDSFIISNQGGDAGSSTLNWYIYRSTNAVYDNGDTLIDAGSIVGGLAAGGNSGAITIDGDLVGGNWTAAGTYYLIARVQAADETDTTNNFGIGGSFSITDPIAPTPDYVVSSISTEIPLVTAESAVSETFSIANVGGAGGVDITWTAYASTDTSLGGDTVIGSGTVSGGLPAGGSAVDIPINGFWPNLSGNFYIIVEVDATDETNRNDVGVSAATIEVRLPPDYVIDSPDLDAIRYGGNLGETLSALGGGTPNFTIREANGQDGIFTLSWKIYISADEYLDAGDTTVLSQGTLPALNAGASSAPINFDDTLPGAPGMHYYIIQVSAPDDKDTGNNVLVTPALYYWDPAPKTETPGTTAIDNSFGSASEYYLKFNSGDGINITGEIDEFAKRDMFVVRTGADPGLTTFEIDLTWAAGFDDLDLYVYDENTDLLDFSITTSINMEPVLSVAVVPNSTYYIEVYAYLNNDTAPAKNNSPGEPYSLIITAP